MLKVLKDYLLKNEPIFFTLVVAFFLRIPNLFEPYWYGDEAIYLTLGHALKSGLLLYRDIIDHKTPIIYILAMVPSQFWFKLLFLFWSLGSVFLFYVISKKLLKSKISIIISTVLFMLLTTLPAFEGNIANGELILMGFVLAALFAFSKSSIFDVFLGKKEYVHANPLPLFFSGFFLSLSVLTKIPAIFDVAALATIAVFIFFNNISVKTISMIIKQMFWIVLGFVVPIVVMIAYFALHKATAELLQFALLYNFHYSGTFGLPFNNPILVFLFSMKGKLHITGLSFIVCLLLKKVARTEVRWMFLWFILSLFASLLSSRPYPHYFIQTLLPLSFLVGFAINGLLQEKKFKKIPPIMAMVVSIVLLVGVIVLLKASLYPTISYYKTYISFATKKTSLEQYRESFNPLMKDTYKGAELIQRTTNKDERIFIWGTNPMLYALSRRNPSGRFTVSFHIKDFKAYGETMDAIRKTTPNWVIIMKDEHGEFPEFYDYLQEHYLQAFSYPTMTFYRRVF